MLDLIQEAKGVIKFLLLFTLVSCSSYQNYGEKNEVKEILNFLSTKRSVYYKTIDKDLGKSIDNLIDINFFEFDLCNSNKKELITNEELKFIKQKFKEVKTINLKKAFNELNVTKNKNIKTDYISLPVIFRKGTAAMYYESARYGGAFNLLIKKNNKWNIVCSKSTWIE
ncbi:hypothetical protein [Tenacibaculum amylolyticum]|uniref:hypothetical protein n=1 Tax=Tenacibaculum amylolyticum TaxID=104269 RepID=UPI0038B5D9A4